MTGWTPRDAMSTSAYIKFKLRMWARVNSLPDWVMDSDPTYREGRVLSHDSDRAYHEKEIWVGENLKYMMMWEPIAQKEVDLVGMYTKIK